MSATSVYQDSIHSIHTGKMRGLLALMVVCVATHSASSDGNIYTLMDKVLVLRVPHASSTQFTVPLVCGEAYKDLRVFWKKNGVNTRLEGNQVDVTVEEMLGAGNFSCHLNNQDGPYLNHTLVLVQLNPDNETVLLENQLKDSSVAKHIMCSGHNYSGSFNCQWHFNRRTATVLLVKADRNLSEIACELEDGGEGVLCNERSCVKVEEQHPVQLEVYVYSNSRLEMYSTKFYLREIVRPRRVTNLREESDNVFHWDGPEFWEEPCSYYKVQFEVNAVRPNSDCSSASRLEHGAEIIDEKMFTITGKTKKYKFCVRAQDKYTKGSWGEWAELAREKKISG